MADLQLFDTGTPPEPQRLSADRRRTRTHEEALARGYHPATGRRLLDPAWGFTCGDCTHCVRTLGRNARRVYAKCERHLLGMSHSAASDIRVGWPACGLFRLDQEATHG